MKKLMKSFVFILLVFCLVFINLFFKQDTPSTIKEENLFSQSVNKDKVSKQKILLEEAENLKRGYFIDEAIEKLLSDSDLVDDKIQSKVDEYKAYKNSFVKYDGSVEHIFFHSLIIYPELAFDNYGHDAEGYNMWFVTVKEFQKMLPLLQERGFVLVKLTDVYKKDASGKMVRNDIYLPQGKKPLIISQDDVNYYDYMKPDGFADKLVLDNENQVSTLVRTPSNGTQITRDGDMVPILDDYVKSHPEFSYKGAKGVLAVTGYEGVLGYRLNSDEDKSQAKKVVNRLKETGWLFASHSYTHNGDGYFGQNPVYNKLVYDFNKWRDQISPIVGKTNLFIAPFGTTLQNKNLGIAKDHGFEIYCNVARSVKDQVLDDIAIMPRFNIDGFTFFKDKENVNNRFFDVDKVIDERRPTLK